MMMHHHNKLQKAEWLKLYLLDKARTDRWMHAIIPIYPTKLHDTTALVPHGGT